MGRAHLLVLAGLAAAAISVPNSAANATGICLQPVPLWVIERMEQAGDDQEMLQQARFDMQLAVDRFCRDYDEVPAADSSQDIGFNCILYSGILLGDRVYWSLCTQPVETSIPASLPVPETAPSTAARSSYWGHNGSVVYLAAEGVGRRFYYERPRDGLRAVGVQEGTLLFEGRKEGDRYIGTAYVFSARCGPQSYAVSGVVSPDQRQVTLYGKAPRVDASCRIADFRDDVLVFTFDRTAAR